ncbi:MAG: hypothetical protein WCB12_03390 [Bryobacteraceae bacterium]
MSFLTSFWKDDQGQDLIEYTLLLAIVALASTAHFVTTGAVSKAMRNCSIPGGEREALCAWQFGSSDRRSVQSSLWRYQ